MRNRNAKSKSRGHLINRAEVARRLGVTAAYVDMLFRGERKNVKRLREIQDLVLDELTAVDNLRRTIKPNRLLKKGNIPSHGTGKRTRPPMGPKTINH